MGGELAAKIRAMPEAQDIDVVIPIPDSSRPSALELANRLGAARTAKASSRTATSGARSSCRGRRCARRASARSSIPIGIEFKGKVVLLVDDSIVRGTTSREIVQMAREAGARKVYFASASPPVRYPNVYGIDMPNQRELVATGRTEAEIAREIGADLLIYQELDALKTRGARRQSAAVRISRRRASTAGTSPATSPPTTSRTSPTSATKSAATTIRTWSMPHARAWPADPPRCDEPRSGVTEWQRVRVALRHDRAVNECPETNPR